MKRPKKMPRFSAKIRQNWISLELQTVNITVLQTNWKHFECFL